MKFSKVRQEQHIGIHTLKNRITKLVNNCKFTDNSTKETIKIMILGHAIKFHEARDWIRLQNQSRVTYQSLLNHCKLLEQRCEQYQKAQLKGRAHLTTLTVATSTTSTIDQDSITRQRNCHQCGYNHPRGNKSKKFQL